MNAAMASQKKYTTGVMGLVNLLKVIAFHNRVQELLLVVEFSANKFNPLASDAHVRGIYDVDTHAKLAWPSNCPKICYKFSIEKQPEFKLYKFTVSPLSLVVQENTEHLRRDLATGQFGDYYFYSFDDAKDEPMGVPGARFEL